MTVSLGKYAFSTMRMTRNDVIHKLLAASVVFFVSIDTAHGAAATLSDSVADSLRPPRVTFTLGVGQMRVRDTYLSPVTYIGPEVSLGYEHHQVCGFGSGNWVRQLNVGMDYAYADNPAGNHHEHALVVSGQWTPMRRWRHVWWQPLTLTAGPMISARGGVLYNTSNSNNVASAHAQIATGVMGSIRWSMQLWGKDIDLRYQASLPALGVFFAPDYDEAYYEIYLGNHSGLANFGWWGNRFDLSHELTADVHLGGTILRLGYRGEAHRSDINHIKVRQFGHQLVVGLGLDFITLKR